MKAAKTSSSEIYQTLQGDLNCFNSIISVLEKLEEDNELSNISNFFSGLIAKEMVYAVTGKVIRAQKDQEHKRGHQGVLAEQHANI